MNNREHIQREMLTEAEYQKILDFIFEIRSPYNKMQNILRCLNTYFGCICSSFWFVKEDFSMVNPIGANISPKLLVDYERNLYEYDDFGLGKMDPNILLRANVLEYDDYVPKDRETPYTSRLKEENIKHKYSLILRDSGKIKGAIALFEPINNRARLPGLSPSCLEAIAPFIAQEFANQQIIDNTEQVLSILQTVLNTSETGIALFDKTDLDNIVYYNPICTKYCFDFMDEGHPKTIVSDFLHSVVAPFDRPYPNIKDLSVELPTRRGNTYLIRVFDNSDQIENVCILFITPKKISQTADKYESLFSQLTPKEREVTLLISQGLTNNQIAERLFISVSTVKSHIQHIFDKASVSNRTSLIAMMRPED